MKKGFTLVELMIVIIIVGILASLGVSQYAKVVEKGREAEALTTLRSLRSAQIAYSLDKDQYFAVETMFPELKQSTGPTNQFWFYSCNNAAPGTGECMAYRYVAPNGKKPGWVGPNPPFIGITPSGKIRRGVYNLN